MYLLHLLHKQNFNDSVLSGLPVSALYPYSTLSSQHSSQVRLLKHQLGHMSPLCSESSCDAHLTQNESISLSAYKICKAQHKPAPSFTSDLISYTLPHSQHSCCCLFACSLLKTFAFVVLLPGKVFLHISSWFPPTQYSNTVTRIRSNHIRWYVKINIDGMLKWKGSLNFIAVKK